MLKNLLGKNIKPVGSIVSVLSKVYNELLETKEKQEGRIEEYNDEIASIELDKKYSEVEIAKAEKISENLKNLLGL